MIQCSKYITVRNVHLILNFKKKSVLYIGFVFFFYIYVDDRGDDVPTVKCTRANCPGKNWSHPDCKSKGKHEPKIGCYDIVCSLNFFHINFVGWVENSAL